MEGNGESYPRAVFSFLSDDHVQPQVFPENALGSGKARKALCEDLQEKFLPKTCQVGTLQVLIFFLDGDLDDPNFSLLKLIGIGTLRVLIFFPRGRLGLSSPR